MGPQKVNMTTEVRMNAEGKRILLPTLGIPGDSSNWDVLVRNIKGLNRDRFRVFLTYMAIIVCHFGHESMDTFLRDLSNGKVPVVERLRDASVVVKNENRGIAKISLVRGVLEFAGGPVNLFQRNFDAALSFNENLTILDPLAKGRIKPAVTFGALHEARLIHLLKSIQPQGLPSSPRELEEFIKARKQELVGRVPIGVPDNIARGLDRELIYNVSHRTIEVFKSELVSKHPALAAAHKDNPMLIFLCYFTNCCLKRCKLVTSHTVDCEALAAWLDSVHGRSFYLSNLAAMKEHQPIERLELIVSAMVWHHRMVAHVDAVTKGFREAAVGRIFSPVSRVMPIASLSKFDGLLGGHSLDDAHQILEGMAIAFDGAHGLKRPHGAVQGIMAKYFFAGRTEVLYEGMPECKAYWRLRQTMDHKSAMRSVLTRCPQ